MLEIVASTHWEGSLESMPCMLCWQRVVFGHRWQIYGVSLTCSWGVVCCFHEEMGKNRWYVFEGWPIVSVGGVVSHPMSVLTVGVGCMVAHELMSVVLSWGRR